MSTHKNINTRIPIDKDNPAIVRDEELCNDCGLCRIACEDVAAVGRMYDLESTGYVPICMNCGQCANVCPTNAIRERYEYKEVQKAIKDPDKTVIFHTAPAVRAGLGEEFGSEPGTFVEGKMVAAIRALKANYVLDTNFSADLTIMEEGSELVDRLVNNSGSFPMFTSCCPAWVKFIETFYPEYIPNLSTAKSPTGMQGVTIKTYFAEQKGIDPTKIVCVAVMPCTAKKFEIRRDEMYVSGQGPGSPKLLANDYVITTRELAKWLKEENINFNALEDSQFDQVMGDATGAGVIFGNTGGVMEAATRSAYYLVTGETPPDHLLNYNLVRGMDGFKSATVDLDGTKVRLAVIHGLNNARRFMESLKQGKSEFDFVEVMCCPGGCIAGGGQPKTEDITNYQICAARTKALYDRDVSLTLRSSHENPEVKALYENYYDEPLSETAHHLLHTSYSDRSNDLGEKGAVYMKPKRRLPLLICDILMFICLLIALQTPVVINLIRGRGGAMAEWEPFLNIHIVVGISLAVLLLLHIILNFHEIMAIKNYFKFPSLVKAQYLLMFSVLISMTISIITGITWAFGTTTNVIRVMHSYSSWLAFLFTGAHIAMHLSKLISLRKFK